MVKLEASLAEMERELTRAEAAHMRERRELLDREAAAVADQERFRSRSILLQGEVCGGLFLSSCDSTVPCHCTRERVVIWRSGVVGFFGVYST